MDINNLEQTEVKDTKQIVVTDEALKYLSETQKWTKFLAIVGIVSVGLLVLVAIFFMIGFSSLSSLMPDSQVNAGLPGIGIGILYLLIAVLYYFPLKYMFTFSTSLRKAVDNIDTETFTYAMLNLKSFNKFLGIFTIVMLSIYGLMIIAGLFAATMFM